MEERYIIAALCDLFFQFGTLFSWDCDNLWCKYICGSCMFTHIFLSPKFFLSKSEKLLLETWWTKVGIDMHLGSSPLTMFFFKSEKTFGRIWNALSKNGDGFFQCHKEVKLGNKTNGPMCTTLWIYAVSDVSVLVIIWQTLKLTRLQETVHDWLRMNNRWNLKQTKRTKDEPSISGTKDMDKYIDTGFC